MDTADQLGLFGGREAMGVVPLEAGPISEERRALAARLPRSLYLGTASWTFAGWIGLVYAKGVPERQLSSRGLTAYARHPLHRTVELDRTFYEPISEEAFARYAVQVPEGFRFIVKAQQVLTLPRFPMQARWGLRQGERNPLLFDVGYCTEQVIEPLVRGLGDKAGPLLFQFSPMEVRSPQRFAEKLHAFLRQLPKGPLYAVELRNRELLTAEYGQALADAGAIHCHNAWERMPDVLAQRDRLPAATRRTLLVRWLLRPNDPYEAARDRFLPFDRLVEEDPVRREDIAALATEAMAAGADAYLSVANNAEGCSPESVALLAEALLRR
jgi:uncharacterized protein YecE (DUF72 family)